ncbi:MAG: hypothetical protein J0651_01800 [Actinobacteria bacterium]|nr:hypothetical protein [Actinomycetota bacterium]
MADEKIVIKIDVDARTTAIEKTTQAVKRLKRESGKFSSGRSDVNTYLQSMDKNLTKSTGKLKRHFDFIDKGVKAFGGVLKKFVSFALKGVILEMAALGAAMLGVHACRCSYQRAASCNVRVPRQGSKGTRLWIEPGTSRDACLADGCRPCRTRCCCSKQVVCGYVKNNEYSANKCEHWIV